MKKVLALVLTLVMVFSLGVTAFAAGGFVESPSNNNPPEIIEGTFDSEDCEGKIIVVPYSERDKLSEDDRNNLEGAYDIISKTDDLTDLNDALKDLADDKNIKGTNLSVSDLFHLVVEGCDDHDGHGGYKLKLKAETLKNFVGLLHFDGKNWSLIVGAKVDGEYLSFASDKLGSFAIVVDSGADETPKTGESNKIYLWIMLFAASAIVLVVLGFKKKA